GNLRVSPLELAEMTLRGVRVARVEGRHEDEIEQGLPVIGICGARLFEERDRAPKFSAVAVGGSQVRQEVRIVGGPAPSLLIRRDRLIPVFPVVIRVAQRGPQLGTLRITVDLLAYLPQAVPRRGGFRSRRVAARPPAPGREVTADESQQAADEEGNE